ncbi:hypothetical protein ACIQMP_07920 [Streptomyces sp. NPDC091385]|uniref:hypothetical protein n=1 Tax=Streptomyces sp. NPDC091385 TaxID=3365997 RepID=UPI003800F050
MTIPPDPITPTVCGVCNHNATDHDLRKSRCSTCQTSCAYRPPRLLACGRCYEEAGEEVHPHPECPINHPDAAAEQIQAARDAYLEQ